jgi:hypothetical protein
LGRDATPHWARNWSTVRPNPRTHTDKTRQSDRRDIFFFDTIQRTSSSSSSFFYPGPITTNERTNANKRGEEKLFNHGLVYISSRLFLPPTYLFFFHRKKKSNPELTNKGEVEHLEGPIKRMKKKNPFFSNQQTTQFKICLKEEACYAPPCYIYISK